MDKRQKLIKLIEHYAKHNIEHAYTYKELVTIATDIGNSHLAEVIEKIAHESEKLTSLFEEAHSILKKE